MAGPLINRSLRAMGRDMHLPGPPFQFKVRTDKSIRFEESSPMFPYKANLRELITFVPSFTTKNLEQSRKEVIRLYRKISRNTPFLLMQYDAWHVSSKQKYIHYIYIYIYITE